MQTSTDYFQSLRLVAAGVPRDSADLFFVKESSVIPKTRDFTAVPCWSIAALWQILRGLDGEYEFSTDLSLEELIEGMVKAIEQIKLQNQ